MSLFDRIKHAAQFAPGLPEKGKYRQFPEIKKPTETQYVAQLHKAEKAGPHFDLRIQIPGTDVGSSWAVPKAKLPKPGQKVLAVRQGDHTVDYFKFKGKIRSGYGKGSVSPAHQGKTEIIESRPDMVRFGVYDKKYPQEFLLRQTKGNQWLLMNTTPTSKKEKLPHSKPKYREKKIDQLNPESSDIWQAKIDGAHAYMVLDKGKRPRIFSYRRGKKAPGGLIEHSQKLVDLWKNVPGVDKHTVLRGEIWGRARGQRNKPLSVSQIGGILNSSTWKARDKQREIGKLQFSPFDIVKHEGRSVERKPYREKYPLIRQISERMKLPLPDTAETVREKKRLLQKIEKGRHPQTREGVVTWGDRASKYKLRPDFDAKITGFFKAEPGSKYEDRAVGGFYVEHNGARSRVGTGISDKLRREMHKDPNRFKGMVATVAAQEKLPSGKLRAPSFVRFHLDKNDPERLSQVKTALHPAAAGALGGAGLGGAIGSISGLLSSDKDEPKWRKALRHGAIGAGVGGAGGALAGSMVPTYKPRSEMESLRHLAQKGSPEKMYTPEEIEAVKGQFEKLKKMMHQEGVEAGTFHKRLPIPKSKLTERDLTEILGFEPVRVAIPESGQDVFTSYRHPEHTYHVHSHPGRWLMHMDEHPAATMIAKGRKTTAGKGKAYAEGMPHVLGEGVPGALAYIRGKLLRGKGLGRRVLKEINPKARRTLRNLPDSPSYVMPSGPEPSGGSVMPKLSAQRFSDRNVVRKILSNKYQDDPWRAQRPARIRAPKKKLDSGRENMTNKLKKRLLQ